MADGLRTFLRCLHRLARGPAGGTLTDGQLLERFVAAGDQAAFEVLVWRHGPMVLNVCRRLLRRPEDAEDAFQAAFLVLVRKARSVRRADALGAWLYRVAYRVALRARAGVARRADREQPAVDEAAAPAADDGAGPDLRPVLDEEINRLPEKYRAAVVLCYLEGKTHQEAAACLGCAEGTVASRLARARGRLRARLVRRGLVVSVTAGAAVLAGKATPAAVGAALVEATTKAALHFAAGGPAAAGVVSARAAALAKGALRAMWATRMKTAAAAVLVAGLLGTGLGGWAYHTLNAAPPAGPDQPRNSAAQPAAADENLLDIPSPREGTIQVVGTEIKEGEKVAPERVVTVKVGGEEKKYRRLRVGDTVEEGQLLARLDDALARDDLLSKQAKVKAAEADWQAAIKTRDEAKRRYEIFKRGLPDAPGQRVISLEDLRAAKLTWERYKAEEVARIAAVQVAKLDVKAAQTVVEMYAIRSPARGVVTRIYRRRGEAVKYLEPVVQVRQAAPESPAAAGAKEQDLLNVPSQRDGILLVVGTEIKKGEKVVPERVVWVRIDGEEKKYVRLRIGDTVEEGQLLARLDDRLARDALDAKKEKVKAAEAEWQAALKTRDEAEHRYKTLDRLWKGKVRNTISAEDVRGAKLTWDRYSSEEIARRADVQVAKLAVQSAQTVVEMYEVRSPARGVVTRLYRRRGEAVKYLEPVVQIRVTDD